MNPERGNRKLRGMSKLQGTNPPGASYLVLGRDEDVVLLQLVHCGVFGGNGTFHRIFQSCSL